MTGFADDLIIGGYRHDKFGRPIWRLRTEDEALEPNEGRAGADIRDGDGYRQLVLKNIVIPNQPFINVKDPPWNAVGDGVTDDTAAIQAAIDSLNTHLEGSPVRADAVHGGTVFFPKGVYKCASSLNLENTTALILAGEGGMTNGQTRPATTISFTAAGTAPKISAKSSYGLVIQDMQVEYTSAAFTGDMIDFRHNAQGYDSAFATIQRCTLWGRGVYSANCLISFCEAILSEVKDCVLGGAQTGVRGREDFGGGNIRYSNGINFDNCTFYILRTGLMNPGQSWRVFKCNFEGTGGTPAASTAMLRALWHDLGTPLSGGEVSFNGCLMTDGSYVESWIDVPANGAMNLTLIDNTIEAGGRNVRIAAGGMLVGFGNRFSVADGLNSIELPASPTVMTNVVLIGNRFTHGTVFGGITNTEHHDSVVILGNRGNTGPISDRLHVGGHISGVNAKPGTTPTVAARTGAGTGPSVVVTGTDVAGRITVTTGTGPAAGNLVDLIYGEAFSAVRSPDSVPKVMLQPRNAAAAGLNVYVNGSETDLTKFVLAIQGAAPAASTQYVWDYHVFQ